MSIVKIPSSRAMQQYALVLLFCLLAHSARAGIAGVSQVLVLHSYHQGYPWTDQVNQGIQDVLGELDEIEVDSLTVNQPVTYFMQQWDSLDKNGFFVYDFFENHGVPMMIVEPESGVIMDANRAAFSFYEYPSLVGKSVYEINKLSEEELYREMQYARKVKQNFFRFKHQIASGEIKDVEIYSYPVSTGGAEFLFSIIVDVTDREVAHSRVQSVYVVIIVLTVMGLFVLLFFVSLLIRNINIRKAAEAQLQKSQEQYRTLLNNLLDIVFRCDEQGRIQQINNVAYEVFGKQKFISQNIWEHLAKENAAQIKRKLRHIIKKQNSIFTLETKTVDNKGNLIYYQVNGVIKFDDQGKVTEIFGIARNITEQKQHSRDILKAIINVQENERKRFAEEIHEGIGPLLSGLKLYLQQESLSVNLNEKQTRVINFSRQLLDEAVAQSRVIANNLTPSILIDFGLEKAVRSFVAKLDHITRCNIVLNIHLSERKLSSDVNIVAYRVLTELINNSLKYSECDTIHIELKDRDNVLLIRYLDNGKGIDAQDRILHPGNNGMGLKNMQSRVNTLNGHFSIKSTNSGGVVAKVEIPLDFQA